MLHEIRMFGLSLGAGVLIAVFYDFWRAVRKNIPHSSFAVAIEDFVFWLVTTGIIMTIFGKFNKGVLRFYVFLGGGMGILCYCFTVSRLIFPLFSWLIKIVVKVLAFFGGIFGKIKIFMKKLIIYPLKKLWERIKIIANNI